MAVYFSVFLLFSGATILPTIINRIMGVTYFDYNTTGWSNTWSSSANSTYTNVASSIGLPLDIILVVFFVTLIVLAYAFVGVGYKQLKEARK